MPGKVCRMPPLLCDVLCTHNVTTSRNNINTPPCKALNLLFNFIYLQFGTVPVGKVPACKHLRCCNGQPGRQTELRFRHLRYSNSQLCRVQWGLDCCLQRSSILEFTTKIKQIFQFKNFFFFSIRNGPSEQKLDFHMKRE